MYYYVREEKKTKVIGFRYPFLQGKISLEDTF